MLAQIAMLSPLSFPVWAAGFYYFRFSEQGLRFRAIAWAYVILYTAFVMLKGKIYYLAPIYPAMFAAGAVALEDISGPRWQPIIRYALPVMILIAGIVLAPMALPVLPVDTFIRYQHALGLKEIHTETRKTTQLPQIYADMFGWPEMVAKIASVYQELSADERREAALLAANYGEAAAIDTVCPRQSAAI